ncbi:MAG: von Willebrand factor type A domain-containing protein [Acidobacteriota bacterium]
MNRRAISRRAKNRPAHIAIHRLAVLALVICLTGIASSAQAKPGWIVGFVVDEAGSPLPGVSVTARGSGAAAEPRVTLTNFKGAYRLGGLGAGLWELTFELDGFSRAVQQIEVKAGGAARLDAAMSLATVAEEIIVTARKPRFYVSRKLATKSQAESRGYRDASPPRQRRQPLPAGVDPAAWSRSDFDTETYEPVEENRFLDPHDHPLSTFAIDVDSASFANVRRFLNQGRRPPRDAVRVEELVNYYPDAYAYESPTGDGIGLQVDVASAPWEPRHHLVRIGLRTRTIDRQERPAANLVFLLDVSGSMADPRKLPWVVDSMKMLVDELEPRDQIGIVVYAGASGVVLPSTWASERATIFDALDRLHAGGSTNGGEGIVAAYGMAQENFIEGGINRVILATDGDWNVGTTSRGDLVRLVRERAKKRIALTCLGFGMGNFRDDLLESLANKGDGNYAYIDGLREARKVLVEQLSGTLVTVAREVKIQIEANPVRVASYRLIGYENRRLAAEDFEDDTKDGGEIGAGFSVTALYEVVPAEVTGTVAVPPRQRLRYQEPARPREAAAEGELMTVSLRYQPPAGGRSQLRQIAVSDRGVSPGEMAPDFAFAAGLAAFGMVLRDSPHRGGADWDLVEGLLAAAAEGPAGPAAEVAGLVAQARTLGL